MSAKLKLVMIYRIDQGMCNKARDKRMTKNTNPTLKDALNAELLEKLKHTKKELEEKERMKKKEEERKRREERKKREKNKSFEELLNESDLDWRKFK